MGNIMRSVNGSKRNEELFIAGVEYLSKKYKIENYTLVTNEGYHINGDTQAELDLKEVLVEIFRGK